MQTCWSRARICQLSPKSGPPFLYSNRNSWWLHASAPLKLHVAVQLSSHQQNRSGSDWLPLKAWAIHTVCVLFSFPPRVIQRFIFRKGSRVFTIQKRSGLWGSREIGWKEPEALNGCLEPSSLSTLNPYNERNKLLGLLIYAMLGLFIILAKSFIQSDHSLRAMSQLKIYNTFEQAYGKIAATI